MIRAKRLILGHFWHVLPKNRALSLFCIPGPLAPQIQKKTNERIPRKQRYGRKNKQMDKQTDKIEFIGPCRLCQGSTNKEFWGPKRAKREPKFTFE